MASLADGVVLLDQLGLFRVLVPAVLITAATYGLLMKFTPLGDHKGINILVSSMIALVLVSATQAVEFIVTFIQYMTVIGTILLFLVILFLFAGVEQKTIAESTKEPIVYVTMIAILVIVLFTVASQTLPQIGAATEGELAGTGVTTKALQTLFHPTILGVIVMFVIFIVAAYAITRAPEAG